MGDGGSWSSRGNTLKSFKKTCLKVVWDTWGIRPSYNRNKGNR